MKNHITCGVLAFGVLTAGCGATLMLAPSDSRTTYVTKKTLLWTRVLHCQAGEGKAPNPVCTEVKETP